MIKTPAVVLTTSSRGTATSGSPTGLEEQDRSLPATSLQGCHEGTAGQASADYGQINHLQIPDSCSDPKESEGRRKKDGWRPVLLLPKSVPEWNSVETFIA